MTAGASLASPVSIHTRCGRAEVMTENLEPICFDAMRARVVPESVATTWTEALPALTGHRLTLRELVAGDSLALLSMLSTEEVAKFISPPPTTEQGFQKFAPDAQ